MNRNETKKNKKKKQEQKITKSNYRHEFSKKPSRVRPFISRYSRIHVLAHTHTPTGMQEAHIMVFRFETALNNHCDTNAPILYPKALQVRSVCWKNTVQTNPISYDTAMQTEEKKIMEMTRFPENGSVYSMCKIVTRKIPTKSHTIHFIRKSTKMSRNIKIRTGKTIVIMQYRRNIRT